MTYAIGDHLIYPNHGAGTVVDRRTRTWNGEEVQYLVIDLDHRDLRVWVPEGEVEEVGAREPVAAGDVDDVLAVLEEHDVRIPQNFTRRLKVNRQRLTTGDVRDVACVVRDLAVRQHRRHLSPTEQDMFRKAKAMLAAELSVSLGTDIEKAEKRIDKALPS